MGRRGAGRCALAVALAVVSASDPLSYHGGSVLAMAGKDSVALVLDKRLGQGNARAPRPAVKVAPPLA